MKRYIFTLALAAMLAFTGCSAADDSNGAQTESIQTEEEDDIEEPEGEIDVPFKELKLKTIDGNVLNFYTKSGDTTIRREAILSEEEAEEVLKRINLTPKEIGCTTGDDIVWFTDGDTNVYIQTMPDGKIYANIYADQQKSAELTEEQKNRIYEIIKAETGADPL